MRADTGQYAVSESEINRLGYFYLARGTISLAIDLVRLNVLAYPKSANVYDSLGEAYLARGDTALGVTNYRKSLDLDPKNTNAAAVLKPIAP
jgi:Flp pilus assembly protein TadD